MRKHLQAMAAVLLLLLSCTFLAAAAATTQTSTPSMRPFLRDVGGTEDAEAGSTTLKSPKRALLTTRHAPIGFPPPPAMTGSPPPY